jgi:hypothetical protein
VSDLVTDGDIPDDIRSNFQGQNALLEL